MPSSFGTQSLTLRDFRGFDTRVSFGVFGADPAGLVAAAQAMLTAINGVTNANDVSEHGVIQNINIGNDYGVGAVYSDIAMKLRIVLRGNTSGKLFSLAIPSPKLTDFLPDGMTMNTADANVAVLVTAINAHVIKEGDTNEQVTVVEGFFQDRRKKRVIGNYTRDPSGVGPA